MDIMMELEELQDARSEYHVKIPNNAPSPPVDGEVFDHIRQRFILF